MQVGQVSKCPSTMDACPCGGRAESERRGDSLGSRRLGPLRGFGCLRVLRRLVLLILHRDPGCCSHALPTSRSHTLLQLASRELADVHGHFACCTPLILRAAQAHTFPRGLVPLVLREFIQRAYCLTLFAGRESPSVRGQGFALTVPSVGFTRLIMSLKELQVALCQG